MRFSYLMMTKVTTIDHTKKFMRRSPECGFEVSDSQDKTPHHPRNSYRIGHCSNLVNPLPSCPIFGGFMTILQGKKELRSCDSL